ncbi:DUF6783 domain-containing protein [Blautia faecicola]|uniref:DUF6783 domain-containing protein n=1 Tax=Blautia faecicola TaxID=2509240 RepID=UPI002FE55F4A
MRVPVCGRFYPNKGGVAGYVNRMRVKYTAKWSSQIAEMIFQTRSRERLRYLFYEEIKSISDYRMVSFADPAAGKTGGSLYRCDNGKWA